MRQSELAVVVYNNFNHSHTLNLMCLVQLEVIDLNDNRPSLSYPSQRDLPCVYSQEALLVNMSSSSSGGLVKSINASNLDLSGEASLVETRE